MMLQKKTAHCANSSRNTFDKVNGYIRKYDCSKKPTLFHSNGKKLKNF